MEIPMATVMPPPVVHPFPHRQLPPNPNAYQPWSVGLLGCSRDYYVRVCISCWCPYITFGQVAEIIDGGTTTCATNGAIYFALQWFTCSAWIYSCMYRSKMRRLYMLQGSDCKDCFLHCCCEARALTQMYRELQNRGFEVSLGWQGNLQRQQMNAAAMVPPAAVGGMIR